MSFNWDGGRESQQTKVKEEEEGGENEILGWNSRSNKTPSARILLTGWNQCNTLNYSLCSWTAHLSASIPLAGVSQEVALWNGSPSQPRLAWILPSLTIADFTFAQPHCTVSLLSWSSFHTYTQLLLLNFLEEFCMVSVERIMIALKYHKLYASSCIFHSLLHPYGQPQ